MKLFWLTYYRIFNLHLYAGLRAGRGTKQNPLSLDDLKPVITALRRMS